MATARQALAIKHPFGYPFNVSKHQSHDQSTARALHSPAFPSYFPFQSLDLAQLSGVVFEGRVLSLVVIGPCVVSLGCLWYQVSSLAPSKTGYLTKAN